MPETTAYPTVSNRRALVCAAIFTWLAGSPILAAPAFKIYVENSGAYRVTYEELVAAGLDGYALSSDGLELTASGESIAMWIADGGDGIFGRGDWIEFIGEHLSGDVSYFNEHSRYNVYELTTDSSHPTHMKATVVDTQVKASVDYIRHQHLEEDLLLLRLPASADEIDELWYQAKLVFNAKKPYRQEIDLGDLGACPSCEPTKLSIALRGWSQPRVKPDPEMTDHQVDVAWNGEPIATAQWNGTRPYLFEVAGLDEEKLLRGENILELSIPRRSPSQDSETLIDVVMLNWVEISYARDDWIDQQTRFTLATPAQAGRLRSTPDRQLVVFGAGGSRAMATSGPASDESIFAVSEGESDFVVSATDALLAPAAVVLDRPTHLRDRDQQADYILIAHRSLLAAAHPLAELHRSRGLAVEEVDLQDVYDEFHYGIAHPQAIRSFLRYASESWQSPAPRFVLLVGDASWDARNANTDDASYADWTYRPGEKGKFAKNTSSPYAEAAEFNRRGLIPTWNYTTYEGHSASDNFFVASDDDFLPHMALGRLPVVEPEEVTRIVEKTVLYATAPEVGPWRRNALLITNESKGFQRQSDELAGQLADAGYGVHKVYPASSDISNEHHSERLVEAFNEGQLVVHFLGHGGRYIWRTGPPDPKKNHDLFTLEHLDHLAPGGRLPIVISLTCYSAPFDHPSADSIGEKLLRLDARGAVAVFAASWRNSPRHHWGKILLEELTTPGATVGEAIMQAKHRIKNRMFVETYNLLGDPALPVALPGGDVALEVSGMTDGPLHVDGIVSMQSFSGQILVEAVDVAGTLLASTTLTTHSSDFSLDLELGEGLSEVRAVLAYAWNSTENVDAAGAYRLAPIEQVPTSTANGKTTP